MGVATSPGFNGSSRRFLACGLRADLTLDRWITLRVLSVRILKVMACPTDSLIPDNFRMNTRYGRYGAAYSMVGLCCFNEELSLLPKNLTEAKLQATSTWGESTEPT
jgi:hypothetical protein